MLRNVGIGHRVRVFLDEVPMPLEGRVEGIERHGDHSVSNLMVRSPHVHGIGIIDIDQELIGRPGFKLEILGRPMSH